MFEPDYLARRAAAVSTFAALIGPATSALAPSSASHGHPDAELFDLVASLQAVEVRQNERARQIEEAFDRFESPAVPEAMIWRESDSPGICSDPHNLLALHDVGGGRWEYVYESIEHLPFVIGKLDVQDRQRGAEIIAAVVEWQAAYRRAEARAGYPALHEASDRDDEGCQALQRKIIFCRACTPEGMMAKVRAMILLFSDDPTWLDQRLQEAVAAGEGDASRWFGMSLALDAMGLEGKTPSPAPDRRAAA